MDNQELIDKFFQMFPGLTMYGKDATKNIKFWLKANLPTKPLREIDKNELYSLLRDILGWDIKQDDLAYKLNKAIRKIFGQPKKKGLS